MPNELSQRPNRRTRGKHEAFSGKVSSKPKSRPEQLESSRGKPITWKKLAIQIGLPGTILTLLISYSAWTTSSIYDLQRDLACVSTKVDCYENFLGLHNGATVETPCPSTCIEGPD